MRGGVFKVPVRLFITVLSVLCFMLFTVTPASAGTYEVSGCASTDGRSDAWFSLGDRRGFTVSGSECPGTGDRRGIFAGNTVNSPDPAPAFTNAMMAFDAPPGAQIVRIRGQARMTGVDGWNAGVHDQTSNVWRWCGPTCTTTYGTWTGFDVGGFTSSRLAALVVCGRSSCARDGEGSRGYVAIKDVVVTVADETKPAISIAETGVAGPGWHRGDQPLVATLNDNVGIAKYEVFIAEGRVGKGDLGICSTFNAVPCPRGEIRSEVSTAQAQDGARTLVVRAVDAAGNVGEAETTVRVDNTAPFAPGNLRLDNEDGWRALNDFSASWINPDRTGASPIAGAEFSLCPADNPEADARGCVTGTRDAAEIQRLDDLKVPGPGAWTLRVRLRDAAGNADGAAAAVTLRYDPAAPEVAFGRPAPDDPARVRLRAGDALSGLRQGAIELHRIGDPTWRTLDTQPDADGFSAAVADEELADGTYELRGQAIDLAGNERSTSRYADGAAATVTLPVRVKTRLIAGQSVRTRAGRGKRPHRRLVVAPRSSFGRSVRLAGRLTTPGGNPLDGRRIDVSQRLELPQAGWSPVGQVVTSRTGRFTYVAPPGASRRLRFRYGGTATVQGRTTEMRLRVRATTSLRPNRSSVVNGEDVVFRGRLKGRPLPPDTSKLVQLQAYTRGRWATFANPRADPRTGAWSFRYRFTATRGRVVYRIRAVVPREASYPFETGRSRSVRVRVRGL